MAIFNLIVNIEIDLLSIHNSYFLASNNKSTYFILYYLY